jgi:ribosomal protein L11 methyltransferase
MLGRAHVARYQLAERLKKVRLATPDIKVAHAAAGLLGELVTPAALAVSVFESMPNGFLVEAYYPAETDLALLEHNLTELRARGLSAIETEPVPDANWVALSQAALAPVVAGRFYVHGSHDRPGRIGAISAIEIDAGEAFGTARHATTAGCLIEIDRLTRAQRFRRVLDIGCGSGILAIATARALPSAQVWASDIDPRATAVTRRNVRVNRSQSRIRVLTAPGLAHPVLRRVSAFDLILSNIVADELMRLAGSLRRTSRPGATVVLSGLLERQAATVVAAYRSQGFRLWRHRRVDGWSTLTLERT